MLSHACCHCQRKKWRQLWLNAIKRADWTETIIKNARVAQRTLLIRKGSIKYFLHLTTKLCHVWNTLMSVYMCVKQQTDDLYIIICNCIYIVVINCGWNNNVAVKIVACWNWNVFIPSSWLDRHGEFVFTNVIHVRRDPSHSNSPVRSSIFWVRV